MSDSTSMTIKHKERSPIIALQQILLNAQESFDELCKVRKTIDEQARNVRASIDDPEAWKSTRIAQRALWTSLIIEIGRLFDSYESQRKKVISFKSIAKNTHLEKVVNGLHGSIIISKIIETRNTYTAHMGTKQSDILSVDEICSSNLNDILKQLNEYVSELRISSENSKNKYD